MNGSTLRAEAQLASNRLALWFHRREVPYSLAMIRMFLPWVLLIGVIPRWFHARELYSTDGAPAPFWVGYGHTDLLPILPASGAVALKTALVFLLVCSSIGWRTRFSLIASAALYSYFGLVDGIGTLTKYTVLGTHVLLILGCSGCGEVWSVDSWGRTSRMPRTPVWPLRLIQILIGVVYLGAAATKMHTPNFFNGDQLSYWMLTNVNWPNPLGEYLTLFPPLLAIFSYITIVWEILFLWLVWKGWGRILMLGLGIVFHILTYMTLGLLIFPLIYVVLYLSFLTESEAKALAGYFTSFRRVPQPNPQARWTWISTTPTFAATLFVAMALGVNAEAQLDIYQSRTGSRPALSALSPERAAELLRNDRKLAPEDKVFAYDMGTTLVQGVLADRRHSYRHGETAIVQVKLIQPHEDMWVGFDVVDHEGRLLRQLGDVAGREHTRPTIELPITEATAPGVYQIHVRVDRRVVAKRTFRVEAG